MADIFHGLVTRADDVAAMLYITPEEVRNSIHRQEFRRAGRTEELMRAIRAERSDTFA